MADRTFTLSEAQQLLPVLESLLNTAMESKAKAEEVEREFQELSRKVFLTGGMLVDFRHTSARKADRETALQHLKDALAEIDAMGVQVKDLDIGLLDFPCLVEDRIVLLCWKRGEKTISYWHGLEEGFRGRKPIDDSILKAQKPKDVN
jgi:hypothetical protein